MSTIVLAVLVGLGIGVVVGALGAGGGILAVPVLVFVLGQDPHDATASSLVIVGLTALASLTHHARAGTVAWRDGALFGLAAVVGALCGARASALVAPHLLMLLFAGLLLCVAAVMLRTALRTRAAERTDGAGAAGVATRSDAQDPARRPPLLRLLLAATTTGLLTGFFGVGGGFIVVPMLVLVLGLGMRRAAGTSLVVMAIATAASLLGRVGTEVHIDWGVTLLFASGSMLGGALGGPLSTRVRPSVLTFAFAGLLGTVGLITAVTELSR